MSYAYYKNRKKEDTDLWEFLSYLIVTLLLKNNYGL